jgi:hypothetical protein
MLVAISERHNQKPKYLNETRQMTEKELSELSDQELLQEAKKMKSNSTINALLIGMMIGVIFYSIVKKSVGIFALIPLFFTHKLFKNSTNNEAIETELKSRNLK